VTSSAAPVVEPTAGFPPVVRTRAELAAARSALPGPVGVVPTMGALHAGHAALLRAARGACRSVLVTIFVNPLQFGPGEDLERYPRTFDADLALSARAGVDLVFAPSPDDVYPEGQPQVRVDPGPLGALLEEASRPGHFSGVLTVVTKLLHLTRADRAYFGEKDYQQLVLIQRMVTDLDLPVEIVPVPTEREADGLALSSRNRYLSAEQRVAAVALSRALRAGQEAAPQGPAAVLAAAEAVLAAESLLRLDRLDLVDAVQLSTPVSPPRPARLLVAAFAGDTRLIDNVPVQWPEE
jgi:pantoate--beta-alanine ligase